jgi:hypothetical protein
MFISHHITKFVATERADGLRREAATVRQQSGRPKQARRLLRRRRQRQLALTEMASEER